MSTEPHILAENLADSLQDLARLNIDSRDGFNFAAEKVQSAQPALAVHFREFASHRDELSASLNAVLQRDARDAVSSGSFLASMHRTLMSVRDALGADSDPYAVLAEAERGEEAISDAYEAIIKEFAGNPITNLLNMQYAEVQNTHEHVRSLRNANRT
jgi:uncharacterized protein (TIGR02284 family)